MTDYPELVKELRYCKDDAYCSICSRYEQGRCFETLHNDSAAAIEYLQAEVDTLKRTDAKRCQECLYLGQPVGEQQLPKRGEWKTTRPDAPMFGFYYCSICGRRRTSPQDNYCPNCGAKMEVQK